jgi:hypothetical protein
MNLHTVSVIQEADEALEEVVCRVEGKKMRRGVKT